MTSSPINREAFLRTLGRWSLAGALAAVGISLARWESSQCPEGAVCEACSERKRCKRAGKADVKP